VSIRVRLLAGTLLVILVPLVLLGLGLRRGMSARLTGVYERRVETSVASIERALRDERESLGGRLAALAGRIEDDNRFRLAAVEHLDAHRDYLLDYTGPAMRLMGLDMLQIQDDSGRIVSSGHFRNEWGRSEPDLPDRLREVGNSPDLATTLSSTAPSPFAFDRSALAVARTPSGPFLALARAHDFRLAGRRFVLVGGVAVNDRFLARLTSDDEIAVTLLGAGTPHSSDGEIARRLGQEASEETRIGELFRASDYIVHRIAVPYAPPGAENGGPVITDATLVVSHRRAPLLLLLRDLERSLLLILAVTAGGALLLSVVLAARIAGPIRRLAKGAETIDLDRLDVDFASDRRDEVGALSRLLAAMIERLRASTEKLRASERRAALGEMARQVNHDLRNAAAPIRNVFRHIAGLRDRPDELARVLGERQGTIDSALTYLEELSRDYAKISAPEARRAIDVGTIVRDVVAAAPAAPGVSLGTEIAPGLPPILAHRTGLRRIVENLVRNARESLSGDGGDVVVAVAAADDNDGAPTVVLTVRDTGCGIDEKDLSRVFDRFYTRKAGGTGLGLPIVRRLVTDFEGTIRVKSERGRGTAVTVAFPASTAPEEKKR